MTKKDIDASMEDQEISENCNTDEMKSDDMSTQEQVVTEDEKNTSENASVEDLGNKLMEINDKYIRLSAEFDNYRKRTLKEKMELMKSAGEGILNKILPVMDNFERAMKSMETTNDAVAVKEGIDIIYTSFKDFLNQNGVKEIECINMEFDTDVHEAVTKIPAPTEELKGKVVDCIQKGYVLNDKVIRFAKVVVGE